MIHSGGLSVILLWTILVGCAGLKPNPIYTTPDSDPNKDIPNITFESEPSGSETSTGLNAHREEMMREIENLLGVPYQYGGSSRYGMDCSGFVQYVFKNSLSYALPRQVTDLYQLGEPVSGDALQFGDLVFFRKIEHMGTSHVGIYLDSNQFAHASLSKGVVFSGLDEPYYTDRYVGAKRIRID